MSRSIVKFKDGEVDRLPDLCRASMWQDYRHIRCSRKATVTEIIDGQEVKFCKTHSSAAQAARNAKSTAAWEARNRKWDHDARLRNASAALVNACLNAVHSSLPPEVQKAVLEYLEASK